MGFQFMYAADTIALLEQTIVQHMATMPHDTTDIPVESCMDFHQCGALDACGNEIWDFLTPWRVQTFIVRMSLSAAELGLPAAAELYVPPGYGWTGHWYGWIGTPQEGQCY